MEDEVPKIPNLELPQKAFQLTLGDDLVPDKSKIKAEIEKEIEEKKMAPYYTYLAEKLKWTVDQDKLAKLTAANEAELTKLNAIIVDAQENLGENELREAHLAKFNYYADIGDKENAIHWNKITFEKTTGVGQKLDLLFTLVRVGFFYNDVELIPKIIERIRVLVESEGDWDRRNRLKVYEAVYLMSIRQFKRSAELFLETLSTFTSTELFSYRQFVHYAVLLNVLALDRVKIQEKVLHAPEILAVLDEIPNLNDFLNQLHNSNYSLFFSALAAQSDQLKVDVYLAPHAAFYVRELRIKAYTQLLESYRSVHLKSMAAQFGVSEAFLDKELSRFIASGRIYCKIDKVGGVVETTRADHKSALYLATIRDGDLLLNRVQKLSRVINL